MISFNRKMAQSQVKVFSLKSSFEKLRFRDRLVWPEGQTKELKATSFPGNEVGNKLSFQISPT